MGRPKSLDDNMVVSLRIEKDMYSILQDLSALYTLQTERPVSVNELIRDAIHFTYSDNERLRECYKRTRTHINKKMQRK